MAHFCPLLCPQSLYHRHTCHNASAYLYCMRSDGMWHSSVPCINDTPVRRYLLPCTAWVLMVCCIVLSPAPLTHLSDCTCLPVLHEVSWFLAQFCLLYHSHACETVPAYLYCVRSDGAWHSSVPCLWITDTPVRLYLPKCTVWGLLICGTFLSPASLTPVSL